MLKFVCQYIPNNNQTVSGVYKMASIMVPRSRIIELLGPSIDCDKCDDYWSGVLQYDDGRTCRVVCWFYQHAISLSIWAETLEGHDTFKEFLEG